MHFVTFSCLFELTRRTFRSPTSVSGLKPDFLSRQCPFLPIQSVLFINLHFPAVFAAPRSRRSLCQSGRQFKQLNFLKTFLLSCRDALRPFSTVPFIPLVMPCSRPPRRYAANESHSRFVRHGISGCPHFTFRWTNQVSRNPSRTRHGAGAGSPLAAHQLTNHAAP